MMRMWSKDTKSTVPGRDSSIFTSSSKLSRKNPKLTKYSPSMDDLSSSFESLKANDKSELEVKRRPRENQFASRTSINQNIRNQSKDQIVLPPDKLNWNYKPNKLHISQGKQENREMKLPKLESILNPSSSSLVIENRLQYRSPVKRSLTPTKITFKNEFETEVSWHTPKRNKVINHDVRTTHKAYNIGLLEWIPTPPKAYNGVSFLTKPVADDTVLESHVFPFFGLSIENMHQTQWKESKIEIQTVQSYVIENLTCRTFPVPIQNSAAHVENDPESSEVKAKVKSILEVVSATELVELKQTHAIEHKIVMVLEKRVKQRLRNVPYYYRQAFMFGRQNKIS